MKNLNVPQTQVFITIVGRAPQVSHTRAKLNPVQMYGSLLGSSDRFLEETRMPLGLWESTFAIFL